MASTFTGATSSTTPSTGSNRKRFLSPNANPPPSPKKQKKQTKLDKLKAELQGQLGNLRDQLTNAREVLLDEEFAHKHAKTVYITLLGACNAFSQARTLQTRSSRNSKRTKRTSQICFSRGRVYAVPWTNVCCSADEFGIADEYFSDVITSRNDLFSYIVTLLYRIVELIEAVLTELAGLPEPSAYAHHAIWRVWQKKPTAVLNLRPQTNQGLPIETLHPVFAAFLNDVRSMPLDEWAPEEDTNTASIGLCKAMADSFNNEIARRTMLKELLRNFGLDVQTEYYIQPTLPQETHSARADLHLSAG